MTTEKLTLPKNGSEFSLDDVTVREVLPSGALGPNILNQWFESEKWELKEDKNE